MSDSDSDWEEDDETTQTPPVVTAAASPAASAVASPSNAVVPSVLIALPITLALKEHPALAGGIPAGLTLLYDQPKNVITMLAYDQHKRPMLLEAFDGTKLLKPSLPFSLTLGDGDNNMMHQSQVVDSQARKWSVTFGTPHEAARMACNIAVATLVAKAAANAHIQQMSVDADSSMQNTQWSSKHAR
jgi:hypothetical protein